MAINMPGVGPDAERVRPGETQEPGKAGGKRLSPSKLYMRRFARNKPALGGLVLFALLVFFSLLGPYLTHWDHVEADFTALSVPPALAVTCWAPTARATTSTPNSCTASAGR